MQIKALIVIIILFWPGALLMAGAPVLPGIADYAAYQMRLKGKNVAIVANQTSVVMPIEVVASQSGPLKIVEEPTGKAVHTVDFLRQKGINIVKIFCPEHGFRGTADAGEKIGDYQDKRTGLPVVSLYGEKKKPLPEDLKGIDIVLFDMQDVGVRFYTYISTLHYLMEACAENRIPLVVMDRPNPNAFYVDGPILDTKYASFVGMHPVPIVYGMTIGEYAAMINGEHWLKGNLTCDLTVIPCKNWTRDMVVRLPQRPSPNLPDEVSVMLYPSICLFEGTVVNEGRGTYTPFQVFGHPALRNMPYSYTPVSIDGMSKGPKCIGKKCFGMNLQNKFEEVRKGGKIRLDWLLTAYKHYQGKESFFTPFFDKLAGSATLREAILNGKTEAEIRKSWQSELDHFKMIRADYLLY